MRWSYSLYVLRFPLIIIIRFQMVTSCDWLWQTKLNKSHFVHQREKEQWEREREWKKNLQLKELMVIFWHKYKEKNLLRSLLTCLGGAYETEHRNRERESWTWNSRMKRCLLHYAQCTVYQTSPNAEQSTKHNLLIYVTVQWIKLNSLVLK